MNKRTAGVMFCLIAGGLEYQGNGLLIFSIISLVVGIVYLVRAEIEDKRK